MGRLERLTGIQLPQGERAALFVQAGEIAQQRPIEVGHPPSSADVRRTVRCAWQRGSNLPEPTPELGLQVLQTSAVLLVPQAAE